MGLYGKAYVKPRGNESLIHTQQLWSYLSILSMGMIQIFLKEMTNKLYLS